MKDFEGFIKNYATRDFIYFFAEKSIEIYKNQVEKLDEHLVCNITFPLNIIQHGFIHKQAKVMLSAWDIPNMAYLSITNSNDYRNDIMTEQLAGRVVNLYRGYENKHSGSEYIGNNGLPSIFKYLMGMSYEQFKYANPAWIYQNYNRNYHMLIGSPNINREKIVDINVITNELFGLTAEELLAVEWIIWWLCSIHPDPLSAPEELYRKKENSILTKKNLERVISYYSVTYEQVRNSSLRKQIFYNKPFVITQKTKETIAVSFYLVQMMIADGLYWLIRDYYHNNHWGTKFIIAFGEMFEDYFEELAGLYLPKNSWHKIPEERKKSADYYVEVDEAVFLFELKSGLLGLGAKQQVPDVGQIDQQYLALIMGQFRIWPGRGRRRFHGGKRQVLRQHRIQRFPGAGAEIGDPAGGARYSAERRGQFCRGELLEFLIGRFIHLRRMCSELGVVDQAGKHLSRLFPGDFPGELNGVDQFFQCFGIVPGLGEEVSGQFQERHHVFVQPGNGDCGLVPLGTNRDLPGQSVAFHLELCGGVGAGACQIRVFPGQAEQPVVIGADGKGQR